jgi:NADPH:quinone reductase-like Zn-dependent oxidoreductase
MQTAAMSSEPSGMRLVFHATGKPADVLQVVRFTPREPAHGEVLVRIIAAPINPADLNTIEGTYGVKLELPATPGVEGCGEVLESRHDDFRQGDRVIFLHRADTWSTHTTVPGGSLFKLPPGIDPLQAAMLKVNPATAWQLLHGFAQPGPGACIVQNAGNSAVGRCVIQLARESGIRTISFVRRRELIDELRELGGSMAEVFPDDEQGLAAAKSALGGAMASLAFNAVGGDSALRLMKLLSEGGTHITYGAMGRKPVTIPNGLLIFRDIRIRGLWVTRWVENAAVDELEATYGKLAARVAAGRLLQPVDGSHPLTDIHAAIARLDAPNRAGKVLLAP